MELELLLTRNVNILCLGHTRSICQHQKQIVIYNSPSSCFSTPGGLNFHAQKNFGPETLFSNGGIPNTCGCLFSPYINQSSLTIFHLSMQVSTCAFIVTQFQFSVPRSKPSLFTASFKCPTCNTSWLNYKLVSSYIKEVKSIRLRNKSIWIILESKSMQVIL